MAFLFVNLNHSGFRELHKVSLYCQYSRLAWCSLCWRSDVIIIQQALATVPNHEEVLFAIMSL